MDTHLICCGLDGYGLILKESLTLEISYYAMDKHLICCGLRMVHTMVQYIVAICILIESLSICL